MTQPPDLPRTPAEIKAWVECLSADQLMGMTQAMMGGVLGQAPGAEDLSPFERGNPPIDLPAPPDEPVLLTVRLVLEDTKPEVWRRLTIPGKLHLGAVHDALQQAMGWTDSHLHRFRAGAAYDSPFFVTPFDVEEGDDGTLETDARLDQVLREAGDQLTYEYDFGDGWTHTLTLERVDPMPAPTPGAGAEQASPAAYPLACLAGEYACPPEDVGGTPGHEDVAEWIRGGEDPRHRFATGLTPDEMREWLPDGWHPDHFDLDEINAALARLVPRDTETALSQLPRELIQVIDRLHTAARFDIDDWLAAPGWAEPVTFTQAEAEALMTPYRAVLDAVGDGLSLTAAGYLPPRFVESIFEQAKLAEEWIGKGNREDLTPPVYDLRERVRRFGLIRKAKGRLLPTAKALRVRDDPEGLLDLVLTRVALDGEEFDRLAGGLVLVSVVGGVPLTIGRWGEVESSAFEAVGHALSIAGWRAGDGQPLERRAAAHGARAFNEPMAQMVKCADGDAEIALDLTRRLALAILRRMD